MPDRLYKNSVASLYLTAEDAWHHCSTFLWDSDATQNQSPDPPDFSYSSSCLHRIFHMPFWTTLVHFPERLAYVSFLHLWAVEGKESRSSVLHNLPINWPTLRPHVWSSWDSESVLQLPGLSLKFGVSLWRTSTWEMWVRIISCASLWSCVLQSYNPEINYSLQPFETFRSSHGGFGLRPPLQ